MGLWANIRWAWGDRPADNPVAKAKYVACIFILATAYIFPPAPLKPIRDLCTLLLLVLFASVQYDVFARLPPYAQDYVHSIIDAQIDTAEKLAELLRGKASSFIRDVALRLKRMAEQAPIYLQHLRVQVARIIQQIFPSQPERFHALLMHWDPQSCKESIEKRQHLMPWDSQDASLIPDIHPQLAFDDGLWFCLIPCTIWESHDLTVRQRLETARIWGKDSNESWCYDETLSESGLKRVLGVKDLGVVQETDTSPSKAQHYALLLSEDWKYNHISWNYVDYAILLAALVVGPTISPRCNQILKASIDMRKTLVATRKQDQIKKLGAVLYAGAVCGLVTCTPLGAAGPFLLSSVSTAVVAGMRMNSDGAGAAESWRVRLGACKDLVARFPQLEPVLEGVM